MQGILRALILYVGILVVTVCGVLLVPGLGLADCSQVHVRVPVVNLREGPGPGRAILGTLKQNTSLDCLEQRNGWMHVTRPGGQTGWVRADLVSRTVVRIHKNERRLMVTRAGREVMTLPVAPGPRGLGTGRYFARLRGGRLVLDWPNRADLRSHLAAGTMAYPAYRKAILDDSQRLDGEGLAICSVTSGGGACGAVLSSVDFSRLVHEVGDGVRVEIYSGSDEDRAINRPDELSHHVFLGALRQCASPAAGLGPDSRPPTLAYPGGDIQPDFALSTDIVIRAVRHAGVDLQSLVHEDVLRHPERYAGLDMGSDPSGAHRRASVLFAWFKHNAVSLPLDVRQDPFGFEAGDIVFFATSMAGDGVPDRTGVVAETFNRAGYPLVITVWDMGQATDRMDLLGREDLEVIGHFRMTHLFDYQ